MQAAACETALYRLLQATLQTKALTSSRDLEISKIQHAVAPKLAKLAAQIQDLEAEIEQYYRENRAEIESGGAKSIEMAYGTIGMRTASNPALLPINPSWSWAKITRKVIKAWKQKFILPPRPQIDKNKIKRVLDADQLAAVGLRLDDEPAFWYELKRAPESKEAAA